MTGCRLISDQGPRVRQMLYLARGSERLCLIAAQSSVSVLYGAGDRRCVYMADISGRDMSSTGSHGSRFTIPVACMSREACQALLALFNQVSATTR